jgi:hypothetical protein
MPFSETTRQQDVLVKHCPDAPRSHKKVEKWNGHQVKDSVSMKGLVKRNRSTHGLILNLFPVSLQLEILLQKLIPHLKNVLYIREKQKPLMYIDINVTVLV